MGRLITERLLSVRQLKGRIRAPTPSHHCRSLSQWCSSVIRGGSRCIPLYDLIVGIPSLSLEIGGLREIDTGSLRRRQREGERVRKKRGRKGRTQYVQCMRDMKSRHSRCVRNLVLHIASRSPMLDEDDIIATFVPRSHRTANSRPRNCTDRWTIPFQRSRTPGYRCSGTMRIRDTQASDLCGVRLCKNRFFLDEDKSRRMD